MKPAVAPGDHILMQGLTYHFHAPRAGDIVVFRTDGLPPAAPHEKYLKRVVGVPGDHVQISGTNLLINGNIVTFSNAAGRIVYIQPQDQYFGSLVVDTIVPYGSYFVLGDNTTNSLDSRYFGCVPGGNIVGRVWFCYWPPTRIGRVP